MVVVRVVCRGESTTTTTTTTTEHVYLNHRFLTLMIIGGSLGRIGKAAERGLRGSRLHRGGQCCVLVAGTGLALQEQTREQETKCEVCPMMQFCTLVAGAMAVLSLHTPGSGRRRAA